MTSAFISNQEKLASLVALNKCITSKYIANKTSCFLHVYQQKKGGFLEEKKGSGNSILLLSQLFAQSSEVQMSLPVELTM